MDMDFFPGGEHFNMDDTTLTGTHKSWTPNLDPQSGPQSGPPYGPQYGPLSKMTISSENSRQI